MGRETASRVPAPSPADLPGSVRDAEPEAADHRLRPRAAHRQRRRATRRDRQVRAFGALEASGLRPAAEFAFRYPARAVGRPAPARRDRRRAGHAAGADRRRRARLDARRLDPDRAPAADARPPPRARPDLPVHHPRPVTGVGDRGPDRGDVPRQDHGDRPGRAGHPRAAQPVHAGPRLRVAVARAADARRACAGGRSSSARRRTRPTSRPAAGSIRAARTRSTAARSRSRPCSTSAPARQAACWLAEGGRSLPVAAADHVRLPGRRRPPCRPRRDPMAPPPRAVRDGLRSGRRHGDRRARAARLPGASRPTCGPPGTMSSPS